MKNSWGVIAGAFMSVLSLLLLIWYSSISLQIFGEAAESHVDKAQADYAMRHLAANLVLARILPGIAILGIAIMAIFHFLGIRSLSKKDEISRPKL